MTRVCQWCGEPIRMPHHGRRFCSVACFRAAPAPPGRERLADRVPPSHEAVMAQCWEAYDAALMAGARGGAT